MSILSLSRINTELKLPLNRIKQNKKRNMDSKWINSDNSGEDDVWTGDEWGTREQRWKRKKKKDETN